jgi:DNA-binding IclR family transcriptional regulator
LCIRRGTRAVCIERIDGIRVNSRVLKLGESLPLHVGAAPRALLAFEDRASWDEYAAIVAGSGEPWRDVRSRSEFYSGLEHIRDQGFVISDNNVTPGIAAIGAPIFDHRGQVAASLSVSGLREGILNRPEGEEPIVDLLLRGTRALSDYLGAPRIASKNDADVSQVIA